VGSAPDLDRTQADGRHLGAGYFVHDLDLRLKSDVLAEVAPAEEPWSLACIVMRRPAVRTPTAMELPTEARRPYMKSRVKAVRKTVERVVACVDCLELAERNAVI